MLYPWYETLQNSNEIRQGDFIQDCPIILPPTNFSIEKSQLVINQELEVQTLDAVVVSQSCDLENNKIEIVLVCPFYSIEYFFESLSPSDRLGKGRERILRALKQGNLPAYHLLNRDEENGIPNFPIVDFRNVYGVSFNFLKTYAPTLARRQRLLPPYREQLSQAFARFFMRVGLPNDIEGLK
jgi:hypothetical protein